MSALAKILKAANQDDKTPELLIRSSKDKGRLIEPNGRGSNTYRSFSPILAKYSCSKPKDSNYTVNYGFLEFSPLFHLTIKSTDDDNAVSISSYDSKNDGSPLDSKLFEIAKPGVNPQEFVRGTVHNLAMMYRLLDKQAKRIQEQNMALEIQGKVIDGLKATRNG